MKLINANNLEYTEINVKCGSETKGERNRLWLKTASKREKPKTRERIKN